MVQRCLGARSEWDARMGGVAAGWMKLLLPFVICLPGIIAFKLLGPGQDPNHVFALMVEKLIPAGLSGLILAGLASAIMSTISSALNSASTVATLDLIQPLWKKDATEEQLVRMGRTLSAVIMLIAIGFGFYFAAQRGQVFMIVQNIYSYFAAPVAALFLLGIFWKRATSTAATVTLIGGFALNEVVDRLLFKLPALTPYDSFFNRAAIVFFLSLAILFLTSLMTEAPPRDAVQNICWRRSDLRLRDSTLPRSKMRWLAISWAGMVGGILAIYAALAVFQWLHS